MKYFFILFFLSIGTGISFCQENVLDAVTVSASLAKQKITASGRNVLIIKGDQLKNLPVKTVDELLRYVPGMEVQSRGPAGVQSDFVLRGSTFQQILVLIDGLRINDPNTGHFNGYIPIAPEEIDHIEILKGASSAIYGTDAVGGVIYIVTKTFASGNGKDTTMIDANAAMGEYGFLNFGGGIYLSKNRLSLSGGLLVNKADGIEQRGTTGFFDNKTVSLSAGYRLSEHWNVSFRTAWDDRSFAAQNFYTTFLSDTASEKIKSFWNQLSISHQKNNSQLSLSAGYKRLSDEYRYSPLSSPNQTTSTLFQTLLLYKLKLNENSTVVTGANYLMKNIESNDRGNHNRFSIAPFAGISSRLFDNFFIHPSVQAVFYENSRPQIVPQLDASYTRKIWLVRASIGKTIREADFTELYNNYEKTLVKSGRIGNPNLTPETSLSYEMGATFFLSSMVKISTTYFKREQQNVIDYVVTPYEEMPRKDNLIEGGSYALAKNIADVNTRGIEADIELQKPVNAKTTIFGTLGLVTLHTDVAGGIKSLYISNHANFTGNFSFILKTQGLSIGFSGLYKTRDPQAAADIKAQLSSEYFVLNAKTGYTFHNTLFAFVEVANIFDREYSDLLGARMPGRWLSFGLQYRHR